MINCYVMSSQLSFDFDSAERLLSSDRYDDFAELCKMAARVPLKIINGKPVNVCQYI